MSAHTPGPWTIEEYGDDDVPSLVVHSSPANRICFMPTPGRIGSREQIAGNARLIAAAPKMLAALKAILAPRGGFVCTYDNYEQVRAVVAEATGEK